MRSRRRSPGLFQIALLLAVLALLEPWTGDGSGSRPAGGDTAPLRPQDLPGIEAAAQALRGGGCEPVRRLLAPVAEASGVRAVEATVLLGLCELECGQPREALRRLDAAGSSNGRFEPWRKIALAEAGAALGMQREALGELDALLVQHPTWPLLGLAAARAAELAVATGEPRRALAWIERGYDGTADLAVRAWEIAADVPDPAARRAAARRLLVDHPLDASRLEVVEIFRRPDGSLAWTEVLDRDQLERRAERLMSVRLPANAAETLGEIPETERGPEWELLYAEALIDDRRGAEALARLDRLTGPAASTSRAEWLKARAARDAAVVRRGRRNLGWADREAMARRAREQLLEVTALSEEEPELAARALGLLASDLAARHDLTGSLEALRRLHAIDPDDRSAARGFWELGWARFEASELDRAIEIWAELGERYPTSPFSRSAVYWSARAHQRLGDSERALAGFRRIAGAPVNDFYRRHALLRLGGGVEATPAVAGDPAAPWPDDPLLAVATLLTELGLDELALRELDGAGEAAETRARYALRARILARLDRPRESIQMVRLAFPELGTPSQSAAPAEALRLYYPLAFGDVIAAQASAQKLSPHLVLAMVRQESAFDTGATSRAGARGLMQVMPATGRELAQRLGLRYRHDLLVDPVYSVRLGTAYFRQVLEMFDQDEELALAGYNAGPYRIRRLWQRAGRDADLDRFVESLPLAETRTYVKRVLLFSDSYRQIYG